MAAYGDTTDMAPATVPLVPPSMSVRPGTGSFEEIYRASYARMVRTARLLMGSPEAAEEVVQDAFVALYARFSTIADPTGYLYRSVVNGCRTGHRRRHLRAQLRPSPLLTQVGPPEIDETWAALRRLSMRSRTVIVLRFYADLPIADIARVLDCPPGTVKSILHRALAHLKDVM